MARWECGWPASRPLAYGHHAFATQHTDIRRQLPHPAMGPEGSRASGQTHLRQLCGLRCARQAFGGENAQRARQALVRVELNSRRGHDARYPLRVVGRRQQFLEMVTATFTRSLAGHKPAGSTP